MLHHGFVDGTQVLLVWIWLVEVGEHEKQFEEHLHTLH